MEDEFDRPEFFSSTPSDDELDQAIARAKAAAEQGPGSIASDEPEDEEDDGKEDDTANDDAPDDDEDDQSYVDEANTPTDDDEGIVQKSQESREKKPVEGQEGSDGEKPLSRKQRGKIIEEYRQELEASQAKERALQEQLRQQEAEDATLATEIDRALGTQEQYEKAVEDGLNGDPDAQEKARAWKANRAFYRKLVKSAGKTYQQEFARQYFDVLQELDGVDMDVVTGKDLTEIVKHIHSAGFQNAEAKYKSQIEKLNKDIQTWKGRAKSSGPQTAGRNSRSPITGGGGPVDPKAFDWRLHYLDGNGLPTDEFESLVQRHGLEPVMAGKFFKRGK